MVRFLIGISVQDQQDVSYHLDRMALYLYVFTFALFVVVIATAAIPTTGSLLATQCNLH